MRNSERREFKRCRLRWAYRYLDGLRPLREDRKLALGTGVHLALAAYYAHPTWLSARSVVGSNEEAREAAFAAYAAWGAAETDSPDFELGFGMLGGYFPFAAKADTFRVLATELSFSVPVVASLVLEGTMDGLVYSLDDARVWVLEHKTAKRIDVEHLDLDEQATSYCWAAGQLLQGQGQAWDGRGPWCWEGKPERLAGVLYNFLRKGQPEPPRITAAGTVSKARTDCTPELYTEAIRASGGRVEDYAKQVSRLQHRPWFQRAKVYRSRSELAQVPIILQAEYEAMEDARRRPEMRYRNPSIDCTWDCAYRELCIGELKGIDMQPLVSLEFIRGGTWQDQKPSEP